MKEGKQNFSIMVMRTLITWLSLPIPLESPFTLAMALDPISVPQGHQPLPQWYCSRVSRQQSQPCPDPPWTLSCCILACPHPPSCSDPGWMGGSRPWWPGSVLPALGPPGPSSWPWGSCWHRQHSDHQCRTTDALSGSRQVTGRPPSSLATSMLLDSVRPWEQDGHI